MVGKRIRGSANPRVKVFLDRQERHQTAQAGFEAHKNRLRPGGQRLTEIFPRHFAKSGNAKQAQFIFGESQPDKLMQLYKNNQFKKDVAQSNHNFDSKSLVTDYGQYFTQG